MSIDKKVNEIKGSDFMPVINRLIEYQKIVDTHIGVNKIEVVNMYLALVEEERTRNGSYRTLVGSREYEQKMQDRYNRVLGVIDEYIDQRIMMKYTTR